MEAYTYHLVASHGIDVIIIPELDCRLVVTEKREYWPQPDDVVLYATIGDRSLVFRVVRYTDKDSSPLHAAIRWYAFHIQSKHVTSNIQAIPPPLSAPAIR